jgi:hypothetical protein
MDKAIQNTWYVWKSMRQRCTNPGTKYFNRYGGRGIKVCKRWDNYASFLSDMGTAPSGLSLDRKDNNGNYEPGNCRWATYAEQSRNNSRTRLLSFSGKTMCVVDWAHELGIKPNTLTKRLLDDWSIERALTEPVRGAK